VNQPAYLSPRKHTTNKVVREDTHHGVRLLPKLKFQKRQAPFRLQSDQET